MSCLRRFWQAAPLSRTPGHPRWAGHLWRAQAVRRARRSSHQRGLLEREREREQESVLSVGFCVGVERAVARAAALALPLLPHPPRRPRCATRHSSVAMTHRPPPLHAVLVRSAHTMPNARTVNRQLTCVHPLFYGISLVPAYSRYMAGVWIHIS